MTRGNCAAQIWGTTRRRMAMAWQAKRAPPTPALESEPLPFTTVLNLMALSHQSLQMTRPAYSASFLGFSASCAPALVSRLLATYATSPGIFLPQPGRVGFGRDSQDFAADVSAAQGRESREKVGRRPSELRRNHGYTAPDFSR